MVLEQDLAHYSTICYLLPAGWTSSIPLEAGRGSSAIRGVMHHTVYVLYSAIGQKYYIGRTADLDRRLIEHNRDDAMGWTKRFQPWELIFKESFPTRTEALRRERYLKLLKNPERLRQYIGGWRSKRLQ